LVYSWKWKRVFGTCLIETGVVDAHLKLLTGLGNDNIVGQPPRVVDLLDKAGVEQLFNFFMDEVLPLNGLLSGFLLDWSCIGVDLQMVLNHLPKDPGHLWWLPDKHINISPQKGVEHEFLFAVQIPHDAGGLGSICPDLNSLHENTLVVRGLHAGCGGW
jgi:hypothetical protein